MSSFLLTQMNVFLWIISYIYPFIALLMLIYGNFDILILYLVTIISFKYMIPNIFSDQYINNIKSNVKSYFKINVINYPTDLKGPNQKIMFAHFPHGMFCAGFAANGGLDKSYIKCITPILLNIPIFGDYLKYMNFKSCSKQNMCKLMKAGDNIMLLPGGFYEVFMMKNYEYNIYVPKGFINLCVKHGYTIYPCLTLGENETYKTITIPKFMWNLVKKFLNYIKLPLIIAFGKWNSFFILPTPLTTIYGDAIDCTPKDDSTINETVDRIHKEVIKSLNKAFYSNIDEYCLTNGFDKNLYSMEIHQN